MNKTHRPSSNKYLSSTHTQIILCTILYVLIMLIGCVFIYSLSFFNHKKELESLAQRRGESVFTSYGHFGDPSFGAEFYFYDYTGRLILQDHSFLESENRARLFSEYGEKVLEKGHIYEPAIFKIAPTESGRSCFGIVAGCVITAYTGRQFVSLVVRDLPDMIITFETFAVIYTLIYITAIVLVLYSVKKHKELDTLRRDLVANVGHELKTPITGIRAMAEIISDGLDKDAAARKRYAHSIINEANKLDLLVKDIMELSRLESGKSKIEKKNISATDLFAPAADRYIMFCGDNGTDLNADDFVLETLPDLNTDPKYANIIFNVLTDNACKFAGKGGSVVLSARRVNDRVIFCVKDNGPGIAASDMPHIFDRFYKSDASYNAKGSGLGLAIASEAAKALGERIWVESTEGEGAAFFFTISLR